MIGPEKRLCTLVKAAFAVVAFCFFLVTVSEAQVRQTLTEKVETDPLKAEFVFSDIENFVDAFSAIEAGADPAEAYKSKYLDKASPGLLMFIEKYDLTVERLTKAVEKYPDDYERIGGTLKILKSRVASFRKAYADLKSKIPKAVFPPTYFVVAGHRGIGSGSVQGPLISIEKESKATILEDLDATLVHEMVHLQQLAATGEAYFAIFSGPERTLLATSIREGAATYFSELITRGSVHKNLARDYYLANEKELWEEFRKDMLGNDMKDWLWETPKREGQPQDLGYVIGARIVESFYVRAKDKGEAAHEIMSIVDYPGFLKKSGYEGEIKTQ